MYRFAELASDARRAVRRAVSERVDDTVMQPDWSSRWAEARALLDEALPPTLRRIAALRCDAGRTVKEIAALERTSPGRVRGWLKEIASRAGAVRLRERWSR